MRALLRFTPIALLLAAACTTPSAPPPRAAAAAAPRPGPPAAGLGRVMGQEATVLLATFGTPALDLREGPARKLQFAGPVCVLDAYLYPPVAGGGPAKVTWVDARTPVGGQIDAASCIAALVRR